ncbi:cobyrinic acid a,c-diamide synthase [Desulfarculus baarsii DSM 2075]|uniref:Cobyrinate a,c-diamide synthase n=1 Tax=Desulfarculus baarsii (strain ATCC 33931 / DSM 2075 / LMG 7858 / VKM B-1802 / 2st14) TaxID=644282 RepID=E1QFJ2_DESB2|nr:cobyrinic acid a,c-diamide synthase [Desulfarculus baarsii DSM 2075]
MAQLQPQLDLPRLAVAATRGGSGKTTLTLGLIQALKDRGLTVAPFKKGPDYIDPFWHSEAAQAPCRNLDPYMMGPAQTLASFDHHGRGFDCAVIEGNRGLYDGMDDQGSFSTAELAKLLKAPTVLTIDCAMATRTVAATVLGMKLFDPALNLAGVILNPVGTARQEGLIRRAVAQYAGLPVLGAIPRLKLDMPQRHMGLVPPQEHEQVAQALHGVARLVAAHVDIDQVWALMASAPPLPAQPKPLGLGPERPPQGQGPRIGVIRDAAFGFYYAENLEALANHGARLVFCSALEDAELPPVEALYIGGGFPETHAARLAANQSFRRSVLAAAEGGLPIYAECGGLMYLGRKLLIDGREHDMVGVFPVDFAMQPKPQGHGYSLCQVLAANPFLPVGARFQAHEFHYSRPQFADATRLSLAYEVIRGRGLHEGKGGLLHKNVMATYHHVHALGLPQWAAGLVNAARSGGSIWA